MYVYIYIYIYGYTYKERERERGDSKTKNDLHEYVDPPCPCGGHQTVGRQETKVFGVHWSNQGHPRAFSLLSLY